MNKRIIRFLIFFITILLMTGISKSENLFQTLVGGSYSATGNSIVASPNGGYVIEGRIDNPSSSIYLAKLSESGSLQWSNITTGNQISQWYQFMIGTSDGGFAIAAGIEINSKRNVYILKLDSNGTFQWNNSIGGPNGGISAKGITQTNDGGYVVTAQTAYSFPGVSQDCYIVKFNSNGQFLWNEVLDFGGSLDIPYAIIKTSDGGCAIAGLTTVSGNVVFLVKLNSAGAVQWSKRIGVSSWGLNSFLQTSDGSYVLAGSSNAYGQGTDAVIIKLDSNGAAVWTKRLAGSNDESGNCIIQTEDGYVICGQTSSFGAGQTDFLIAKLSLDGNLQWCKTLGGAQTDYSSSIVKSNDGGYVCVGSTVSFGQPTNTSHILAVKFDSSGNTCSHSNSVTPTFGSVAPSVANLLYGVIAVTGSVVTPSASFSTLDSSQNICPPPCNMTVNAGNDTTIWDLAGDHANLAASAAGGTAPIHYSWSTGDTTQSITVSPSDTTIYVVNVTDSAGCSASDTVKVNVFKVACGNNGVLVCIRGRTKCIKLNQLQNALNHGATLGPCGSGAQLLTLFENYPNPFNPVTEIRFSIPEASHVKVVIYDIIGREVAKLVDENLDAGIHRINWDATNFASGVYFYTFSAGSFYETKKMVLMK